MTNRGLTSVVSEILAIVILLGVIGILSSLLYGVVVPDYETTTTRQQTDRLLEHVCYRIDTAAMASGQFRATLWLSLPETIQGQQYRIAVNDRSLVVRHPSLPVDRDHQLPDRIDSATGSWSGGGPLVVRIVGDHGTIALELDETDEPIA